MHVLRQVSCVGYRLAPELFYNAMSTAEVSFVYNYMREWLCTIIQKERSQEEKIGGKK
jgi:hypothetical protein